MFVPAHQELHWKSPAPWTERDVYPLPPATTELSSVSQAWHVLSQKPG